MQQQRAQNLRVPLPRSRHQRCLHAGPGFSARAGPDFPRAQELLVAVRARCQQPPRRVCVPTPCSLVEVWGLKCGVWGVGCGIRDEGFGVWGVGFEVWGWGFGVCQGFGVRFEGWGCRLEDQAVSRARPVLGMMGGAAASEQSGNISKGFEDFDLQVKNIIWP